MMIVRIMPQKLVEILAGEETWARVLRNGNASDVLHAAFHRTEEALDHEYEVCLCMYMPLTCLSGAAKSHS